MANVPRTLLFAGIGLLVVYGIGQVGETNLIPRDTVEPNWAAISDWPGVQSAEVDAQPDPNRIYTAIVLDDSGSMGADMPAAKQAVLAALEAMGDDDAVSVIALNDGLILPFMSVADARQALPVPLDRVISDGSTPLTRAVRLAREGLSAEAARVGGFGTYRVLVTTDGAADDGNALQAEIESIARETPIQVATIGVGVSGGHVLRRPDLASFVAINDISDLATALASAVAEEQTFTAITDFGGN